MPLRGSLKLCFTTHTWDTESFNVATGFKIVSAVRPNYLCACRRSEVEQMASAQMANPITYGSVLGGRCAQMA